MEDELFQSWLEAMRSLDYSRQLEKAGLIRRSNAYFPESTIYDRPDNDYRVVPISELLKSYLGDRGDYDGR